MISLWGSSVLPADQLVNYCSFQLSALWQRLYSISILNVLWDTKSITGPALAVRVSAIWTCHYTFLRALRCNVLQSCPENIASKELDFQFLQCFAGGSESRGIADTDSLLDVLEQFVQFYKCENGAHNKSVLKEDAVKRFLKLLSSVKGTASSHFSPSQNLIAVKNVFDANIQFFALLPFLPIPVSATDITGTMWFCLFLLLCFACRTTGICSKFQYDESKYSD